MSSITSGPEGWQGRFVSVLDVLLYLGEYVAKIDSLLVFIGDHDVERFKAFEGGILAYRFLCGATNSDYLSFLEWLSLRHALSSDGWQGRFLAERGGDHLGAIRKYLDECAEYRATHARTA
jgi:hypothetical protein